jgi:hypothetical protein
MKKKLLFLCVCALLLLCAAAVPASASRDTYPSPAYPPYWFNVDPWGSGVYWVDETAITSGGPIAAVPLAPGSSVSPPIYVGGTWLCATYGQSIRQAKALLQRLEVWTYAKDGSRVDIITPIDESTSQSYWVGPYDVNTAYGHDYAPYNPKVQSGIWGMDWMIPTGPLPAGTYWVKYSDKLTHWICDPLFDKKAFHYEPFDWTDNGTWSFVVE